MSITNAISLDSGDPLVQELRERGLSIGRAVNTDWTLSDPRRHVSSLHCDIEYRDGHYVLTDRSTNGTFLNGSSERMAGPHTLRDGDCLRIGRYEVRVGLVDSGLADSGLVDSGLAVSGLAQNSGSANSFGQALPHPPILHGYDPLIGGFVQPPPTPSGASTDPFGLIASGPGPTPQQQPPNSLPPPVDQADPFGLAGSTSKAAAPAAAPPAAASAADVDPWARLHAFDQIDFSGPCTDPVPPADDAPLLSTAAATAAPEPAAALAVLLAAAGLKAQDFADQPPEAILRSAGQLLLQAADGLIRLLEARTRVRHQFGVGAHLTPFQSQGKNPLKWTRMPDQALRQMLGQADRGFLPGAHAVQGAFEDLQAHEIAMLAAMQDALAATMARFSPTAIKTRAQAKDGILPGAREAALWRFFEAEYERLAADNDAVYLDVFARHFRVAYERNLG